MSIDVHESVAAGQDAARRVGRRAAETVEAARAIDLHAIDLHGPAQTAKKVAKRTAKRAAKKAAVAAERATKRTVKRKAKRTLGRVAFIALAVGAAVVVGVAVARRMRGPADPWADAAPDPFGAAVTESGRTGDGSSGDPTSVDGDEPRSESTSAPASNN